MDTRVKMEMLSKSVSCIISCKGLLYFLKKHKKITVKSCVEKQVGGTRARSFFFGAVLNLQCITGILLEILCIMTSKLFVKETLPKKVELTDHFKFSELFCLYSHEATGTDDILYIV